MELHWNILDENRKGILPLLKDASVDGFYLAGGTGLALQLGHRDSIDFDFFKEGDFDIDQHIEKIQSVFSEHKITITQKEKNTVSCVVDDTIQLSFFGYKYALLMPAINTEYFRIASVSDIGCMKLSAITGRSLEKDYTDLYFILQEIALQELLRFCSQKYPSLDPALLLKSLVYFDDVTEEPILYKEGHNVSFQTVKEFLQNTVSDYFKFSKN